MVFAGFFCMMHNYYRFSKIISVRFRTQFRRFLAIRIRFGA